MNKGIKSGEDNNLVINKAKLHSLNIYEITEDELERFERGGPDSIFLNFSIFSLSVAISFLITLLTTEIKEDRVFYLFIIIIILGFLSGIILIILWFKNKTSIKRVIERIRKRMHKKC